MKVLSTFILGVLLFANVTIAQAIAPGSRVSAVIETVKNEVEKGRSALSKEALDDKLKELIFPIFDFREMSRRSLGTNWKLATPQEQKEFVDLFSELLAKSYLEKIKSNIEGSKFAIKGETVSGKVALVKTVVFADGDDVTIDYRMRLKDSEWKIYDVIVQNIGLVSNYRSEFSDIVRKDKIAGLIKRLKEKTAANS